MQREESIESGQSLLELLIALGMILLAISAAAIAFFGGQTLLTDAGVANEATYIAKSMLEAARETARLNFGGLTSSTSTEDMFTKRLTVEEVAADTKKVTAEVEWRAELLRPQRVKLVTLLTDWRNILPPADPADTGGGGITGDWKNPRTLGSIDLGPGNEATDVDVVNRIVFLSAEASDKKKPDLFIVDATDGQNPFIVSSLDTGPGLNALDVSGDYAYLANNDQNAQFQIVNVSNRSNPLLVTSLQLPGVSGNGAIGWSIFYTNGRIYLGTAEANGPEFFVIDVSNPSSPTVLGSKEIGANVNDIAVNGNLAYIATSRDEVEIYNISNPAAITKVGAYDAPGATEDGSAVQLVSASRLYLGRLAGTGSSAYHELHILNVTNPAMPQNLGSKDIGASVNDLYARDELIFLATDDANREFQVWNVADPANIQFWSSFNFPQVASGIDYEDNLVYVSVRSNDALRIITSSP